MPPSTCLMEDSIEGCTTIRIGCQASASYHRVAPQANTSRTRFRPLRQSDMSRARPARTRRSTIYHSIYINSSVPSFLSILLAFPRLACFLGSRLAQFSPPPGVQRLGSFLPFQNSRSVEKRDFPVSPCFPFRSIRSHLQQLRRSAQRSSSLLRCFHRFNRCRPPLFRLASPY